MIVTEKMAWIVYSVIQIIGFGFNALALITWDIDYAFISGFIHLYGHALLLGYYALRNHLEYQYKIDAIYEHFFGEDGKADE